MGEISPDQRTAWRVMAANDSASSQALPDAHPPALRNRQGIGPDEAIPPVSRGLAVHSRFASGRISQLSELVEDYRKAPRVCARSRSAAQSLRRPTFGSATGRPWSRTSSSFRR
jgi:hypothetical protein